MGKELITAYLGERSLVLLVAIGCCFGLGPEAAAQLRIVNYNTLDKPLDATATSQFSTIMTAIANDSINGIAKRPDVLALQEQFRGLVGGNIVDTSANIASILNGLFPGAAYQSNIIGAGTDRLVVVHDASTVQLLENVNISTSPLTRPTPRVKFRPVGYSSPDAEFYVYDMHLKAGSFASDYDRRNQETVVIRNNADTIASGLQGAGREVNMIYTGDFNLYSNVDQAYQNLTAPGSAQAVDPLALEFWPNSAQAIHLTQSTRSGSLADEGASGGMDDRFDFQIVTSDLMDGEGLSYIGPTVPGLVGTDRSYRAFGNDGVSYNQSNNNTYVGRSQPQAVIDALYNFSDHLPVIVDYQLPAVMEAVLGDLPASLMLGEQASIELTVRNIADVISQYGADELDYSISSVGDLFGSTMGSEVALAPGAVHLLELDTSNVGMKSGTITVESLSEGVQNSLITIPISFEVFAASVPGDYNGDLVVDAADYTVWRDTLGSMDDLRANGDNTGPSAGVVDEADFAFWKLHFGESLSGAGATTATNHVPEPCSLLLLLIGLMLIRPEVYFASSGVCRRFTFDSMYA